MTKAQLAAGPGAKRAPRTARSKTSQAARAWTRREKRAVERVGEIAGRPQDGERPRLMVAVERRRHDRDGADLRVTHTSEALAGVPQSPPRLRAHHIDAYTVRGDHRSSPAHCCLSTSVNPEAAMIAT